MNPNEFFYWLQGYFELAPSSSEPLHPGQVETIRRHAKLVYETVPNAPGVVAIEFLLYGHAAAPGAVTAAIVAIVSSVFEHVIDPSYGPPGKQDELNKIHGDMVARC